MTLDNGDFCELTIVFVFVFFIAIRVEVNFGNCCSFIRHVFRVGTFPSQAQGYPNTYGQ